MPNEKPPVKVFPVKGMMINVSMKRMKLLLMVLKAIRILKMKKAIMKMMLRILR